MASLLNCDQDGVLRSYSETPPTHYTLKIESFSLLTKHCVDKYESQEFEAGGYEWKLVLYPNGNQMRNAAEHISLYVEMAGANSLLTGWEVYVNVRLFLLDQINGLYYILQDAKEKSRPNKKDAKEKKWCLHSMMPYSGFDRFISLEVFNNACSGYIMDDTCVFGAEVFVCKERRTGIVERLSMFEYSVMQRHVWKVEKFLKLNDKRYYSKSFDAGNQKWKILLYPKGSVGAKGTHVSLYLAMDDPAKSTGSKILAEFSLRILDQMHGKHTAKQAFHWFSASAPDWGWHPMIALGTLIQPDKGFLKKDCLFVEAEVTVHGIVEAL